ncbi:polyadenylate-specific 3'-exoribonuclease AS [Nocardia sp. NBC_01503]|uniref:polyadenylate-specific 3'-exoribonuclease AS n=1 Tax=Nocardia sp. NBC_01503 TaxID=2975997 RepID=UPI002E7B8F0D|nr:polyadenylate-specific 3'-exoribonuclease AS [Nocardia sp. NBC_01503]WTL36588.1 polyadenylate-specific 3'-exoribonuclease AS [Nocardia sp. NBC_01503]
MSLRYFYDSEFIENGVTIDLVSIAVVCEDGREYYAVSTEFDADKAGPFVRRNVLPKLPPPASHLWRSREKIREDLYRFFLPRPGIEPELWAWVGAYDHVALCQLWGSMVDLPNALPRYTNELRQHWNQHGQPPLPPIPKDAHDALADARHNLAKFEAIEAHRRIRSGA